MVVLSCVVHHLILLLSLLIFAAELQHLLMLLNHHMTFIRPVPLCRIFVPLPDIAQREKILQVILNTEDLDPTFDFREAAELSDGYSGRCCC